MIEEAKKIVDALLAEFGGSPRRALNNAYWAAKESDGSDLPEAVYNEVIDDLNARRLKGMIQGGDIALPSGQVITSGQGGYYSVGSDVYPVTIIGWSKSGKTLYYQAALAQPTETHEHFGRQDYTFEPDPNAGIQIATWRRPGRVGGRNGRFVPQGATTTTIGTTGYHKRIDPSF